MSKKMTELIGEIRESMMRIALAAQTEEREIILQALTEIICQKSDFLRRIGEIWEDEFVVAHHMNGLGGARLKRVREILEEFLILSEIPSWEKNWEEAKAKGYDPSNLPPCEICGLHPVSSVPGEGRDVMVDHGCKKSELNFQGPGHLWFLCEYKGDRKWVVSLFGFDLHIIRRIDSLHSIVQIEEIRRGNKT